MEIYELTNKGKMIARSYRPSPSAHPERLKVINFLARQRAASSETICDYVPDATPTTLSHLVFKGLIQPVGGGVPS